MYIDTLRHYKLIFGTYSSIYERSDRVRVQAKFTLNLTNLLIN